jgi:hypothetical protein
VQWTRVDFAIPRAHVQRHPDQRHPDVFQSSGHSCGRMGRVSPSLLPSEGVGRPSYGECKTIDFA